MNGIKFDVTLKDALVESVLEEYTEVIENVQKQEISFSRQYLLKKKRMIRNPGAFLKKKIQPYYVKMVRVFVVAALIILMAIAAGAALIP